MSQYPEHSVSNRSYFCKICVIEHDITVRAAKTVNSMNLSVVCSEFLSVYAENTVYTVIIVLTL